MKICPACGSSISVLSHMAQSEGGDFHCPKCRVELVQELSTVGKLLTAGAVVAMFAAIVPPFSMWLLAAGAAMGSCAWQWGGEYKSTGRTLRAGDTVGDITTLRDAFSKPMVFAGSFVGLLGICFILLALRVAWVIDSGVTAPTPGFIQTGAV